MTRRETQILQDWLWNFSGTRLVLLRSHLKMITIKFTTGQSRLIRCIKRIFQISACFIQGAKISKIAEQHAISLLTLRQFIAASMASGNIEKLMLGKVAIAPLSQLKEQNSKISLKAFWKASI